MASRNTRQVMGTLHEFPVKENFDARFDRIMDELQREREINTRKWEENQREREINTRKWEENQRNLERMQAEWNRQQEEWNKRFDKQHQEIMAISTKVDSTLSAVGARWGVAAESAFRDGIAAILRDIFDVEVLNVNEYDEEGMVFGHPDQVEMDVIIKNGILICMEIKSNLDRGAVYLFERKVRFYERRHERKADRLMIVSPMIEPPAREKAKELGIETYGWVREVKWP